MPYVIEETEVNPLTVAHLRTISLYRSTSYHAHWNGHVTQREIDVATVTGLIERSDIA